MTYRRRDIYQNNNADWGERAPKVLSGIWEDNWEELLVSHYAWIFRVSAHDVHKNGSSDYFVSHGKANPTKSNCHNTAITLGGFLHLHIRKQWVQEVSLLLNWHYTQRVAVWGTKMRQWFLEVSVRFSQHCINFHILLAQTELNHEISPVYFYNLLYINISICFPAKGKIHAAIILPLLKKENLTLGSFRTTS